MSRKKQDTALVASAKRGTLNWKDSAALQRVFETIPKQEIIAALIDSGDTKAIQLAERLSDTEFDRSNLALHCAKVQILPKDVWNILIETRKLSARLVLSEKLPEIVETVADAAVNKIGKCPRCDGSGLNSEKEGEKCTLCNGSGEIFSAADKESQKMALEMGELLNLRVPLVAQQFNSFGKGGMTDLGVPDMADWVRSSDATFEENRPKDVIDVEVIKTEA